MIEELTQPVSTEVLKIIEEVAAVGTTSGARESSHSGELLEGLPPISPQPSKISSFNNLSLGVIIDIIAMVVGDFAPTQTEEHLMGTVVEAISPTSDRVSIAIVEPGLGSILLVLTLAMDILEELSLQMVRQFFTTMEIDPNWYFLGEVPSNSYEHFLRTRLKISNKREVLIAREHIKC